MSHLVLCICINMFIDVTRQHVSAFPVSNCLRISKRGQAPLFILYSVEGQTGRRGRKRKYGRRVNDCGERGEMVRVKGKGKKVRLSLKVNIWANR